MAISKAAALNLIGTFQLLKGDFLLTGPQDSATMRSIFGTFLY